MSDEVKSTGDLHSADDAEGHKARFDVGEPPVEGGRFRPTAVADDDDVEGHRKMSATGDDGDEGDDTEGHRISL